MRASLLFCLPLIASCYLSHTVGDDAGAVDLGRADLGVVTHDSGVVFFDAGTCTPPTAANGDAIRMHCEPTSHGHCPDGYSCEAHEGAVVSFSCEILCPTGCECPAETTCGTFVDKAGSHRYCQPMPILI